jgi:hypothetical protein
MKLIFVSLNTYLEEVTLGVRSELELELLEETRFLPKINRKYTLPD